ncbi:MAG TPA: class I SAM-dependent methyltransferase [Chitinophagales bacterium]|nr:class I SAM-dependent methyltransferase [Chitinophagales bacterium]HMX03689.1 class I SAM-dependent methyltransferase [Chitinophagales bacterium]HMZ89828.1 class I SAM-dependent methyltransferase [Chitinophagales bacterium]HNA57880.1 class I SAM-dependent methyltransferase [Chitinophagales bacterium]HNE44662.1 class I SAM-dependent methyltransferase [Chitinophagales bacterium]
MYFHSIGRPFVGKKISAVLPFLPKDVPVLDIGSGNGLAASLMMEAGCKIVPIDIHEGQYHDSVKPTVYDGKHLPYVDNHFEAGVILTVLHHVDDPDALLKEIMRVCKSLVIMEDIYENAFQKNITFWLDSLANLWYSPCPHTNKNDIGWKSLFNAMDLELTDVRYRNAFFVIKQAVYVVSKKSQ